MTSTPDTHIMIIQEQVYILVMLDIYIYTLYSVYMYIYSKEAICSGYVVYIFKGVLVPRVYTLGVSKNVLFFP